MAITIRDANIKKELNILQDLLNRNRDQTFDRDRFVWLYLDNPEGSAKAWFVIDEATNQAVAFTAVLPRMFMVEGRKITVWNCSDFSVDKKFRTLGIAIKLRRIAKDAIEDGYTPALYAHPNDNRMDIVHQKVGHKRLGGMQRFVKLLDTRKFIENKIHSKIISAILSNTINIVFTFIDLTNKTEGNYHFKTSTNTLFGKEFDILFYNACKAYRILGDRRSTYLNWRFSKNPLYETECLEIYDDSSLAGYILYFEDNGKVHLLDILFIPPKKNGHALLRMWIKLMRKRKVDSISLVLLESNPFISLFKKHGFRKRPEESSVFVYAEPESWLEPIWTNGGNWFMTVGDRDV
ncbi:hypothetical protein ACFL6N_06355 [Thermodesulfobacteriota bacterium]